MKKDYHIPAIEFIIFPECILIFGLIVLLIIDSLSIRMVRSDV